jgi:hypothetical protein
MDIARLKELAVRFGPATLGGLLLGVLLMSLLASPEPSVEVSAPPPPRPDAQRIADSALVSVRDHGRLVTHRARYVAIVSSAESRLGLEARKTLILPADVRYGLDLGRLRREHLSWDEGTRTLSIELPPLEISAPEIDMEEAKEFREGGVLLALTGSESELDQANLRLAREDLLRQARQSRPLQAARDAALRAVARAFALPLRAAGIEASVATRFVDPEGRDEAVHLDRSSRVEDAVNDRQAGNPPADQGNGE